MGMCLIGLPAMATMEGGTVITARSSTEAGCSATRCNGRKFYVSNEGMTWWTTFTWCQSNGLEPATFAEACPPGNPVAYRGENSCPNLKDLLSWDTWTADSYPSNKASAYCLYNGDFFGHTYSKETKRKALCIMPETTE